MLLEILYAIPAGNFFVPAGTLAKDLSIKESTLNQHVIKLIEMGWVIKRRVIDEPSRPTAYSLDSNQSRLLADFSALEDRAEQLLSLTPEAVLYEIVRWRRVKKL